MSAAKIVLLAIFLVGAVAALFLASRELSREAINPSVRAIRELGAIQMGIERFKLDAGRYPAEREGVGALVERPYALSSDRWRGPYLEFKEKDLRLDPWGRPYLYRLLKNGRGMGYSLGADGEPGGVGQARDVMGISEVSRKAESNRRRGGSSLDVLK